MEISAFLVRAKKDTYASGKKPTVLEDGFEQFTYQEGTLSYRDRYRARDPRPFGGEEVVFQEGKPVWMMNYHGFMLSKEVESKKVYSFLRKAMSLVEEDRPFRGCSTLKEGDYEYKDISTGDLNQFVGTEKIFFKGEEVYRLEYHGGAL